MLRNSQVQGLKQSLNINPQQIRFLNFLQLSPNELEDYIEKEVEENPFLIAEQNEFKSIGKSQSNSTSENWIQNTVQEEENLRDLLKNQLSMMNLSHRMLTITHFIVDSIDDKGFFKADKEDFLDHISFAHNLFYEMGELEHGIQVVQSLDPYGVATTGVHDYLLFQTKKEPLLFQILEHYFDAIAAHQYEVILDQLKINKEELEIELKKLKKLKPYPSFGYALSSNVRANLIFPEYKVENQDGKLNFQVLRNYGKKLDIDNTYQLELATVKKAKTFVNDKINMAQWLIAALAQRGATMQLAIQEIVRRQESFFKTGDWQELKPMILKDVAESIGKTISTVSRVTSSKYVETDFGIIPLKSLFSEAIISTDGRLISNREIQDMVEQYIEEEDKTQPLTDKDIMYKLETKGIKLTRRTISKYRDHLNIAPSKLRRTLSL